MAEAQAEGIASALGLEHGVCGWEQLFAVFPEPWFVGSPVVAAPKLVDPPGVEQAPRQLAERLRPVSRVMAVAERAQTSRWA